MIRFEEGPEPLTEESWDHPPRLAESEALRILHREIGRYANRKSAGRSFLVAGHRGSGKTTTLRLAVQRAQRDALAGDLKLWPVLISLHGPDLLDAENADRPTGANGTKPAGKAGSEQSGGSGERTTGNGTTTKNEKPNPAAAALRMLAKNLHRALADELARGFRRRVKELLKSRPGSDDLLELAAHVEHELDHAANVADLREYWRRAEAFESGVLRAERGQWGKALDAGQGARELTAIATAIEAFQVIAGKPQREDKANQLNKEDRKSTFGVNAGKDLFNSLAGAITGGALGVGMLANNGSPWLAALVGVGSAIAATLTLNYTVTRSRVATRDVVRNFTWDTSIASLDRMLPVLIERMLNAGIAPIFAVDELDKVANLENVMGNLITHLKHFVTEKAFFCFLCDRSYFERIIDSGLTGDYSKEFTFFSDRLFLHYTPSELKAYLATVLTADPADSTDLKFLGHLLLQSCRLSPIGLRRELTRYIDDKGNFILQRGAILGAQGYQMRAFMQLAVEDVYGESKDAAQERPLSKRMRQDWLFGRLAADTLYYPAIEWAKNTGTIDVSEQAFKRYLERRLNGDAEEDGAHATTPADGTQAEGKVEEPKRKRLEISEVEFAFLYAILNELLEHLREPGNLLEGDTASPHVFAGFEPRLIPDLLEGGEEDLWNWSHDPFGGKIVQRTAPPALEPAAPLPTQSPQRPPERGSAVKPDAGPGEAALPAAERAPGAEAPVAATPPRVEQQRKTAEPARTPAAPAPPPQGVPDNGDSTRTSAKSTQDQIDLVRRHAKEQGRPVLPPSPARAASPKPRTTKRGARLSKGRPLTPGPTEEHRAAAEIKADWIAQVQSALEPFSRSVTLEDLAQKYRILEPSPAWSTVAAAIRRVVAPRARASDLRDEITVINVYQEMLRASGGLLCDVLLLAASSGRRSAPPAYGDDLADAIKLVSDVFSLGQVPPDKGRQLVASARTQLLAETPGAVQNIFAPIMATAAQDLPAWLERLNEPEARSATLDLQAIVANRSVPSEVEREWSDFLKQHSFGFESVYDASLDDFALAAQNRQSLVAFIDNMTLGQLWSLPRPTNSDLGASLLAFLGVHQNLRARQVRPDEKVLLLVDPAMRADGIAAHWKPSSKHSVFMAEFMGDLASRVIPDFRANLWAPGWQPTLILVETRETGPIGPLGLPFAPMVAEPAPSTPIYSVVHSANRPPGLPRSASPIEAASVDEAVDLAKSPPQANVH